jgi:hypothetical protein
VCFGWSTGRHQFDHAFEQKQPVIVRGGHSPSLLKSQRKNGQHPLPVSFYQSGT